MDKTLRREIFLRGQDAEVFRASVQALIDREPTADEVDEFLNRYSGLMTQPLTLH
jgi:transcriptional regulator of nitric oxide reductase